MQDAHFIDTVCQSASLEPADVASARKLLLRQPLTRKVRHFKLGLHGDV